MLWPSGKTACDGSLTSVYGIAVESPPGAHHGLRVEKMVLSMENMFGGRKNHVGFGARQLYILVITHKGSSERPFGGGGTWCNGFSQREPEQAGEADRTPRRDSGALAANGEALSVYQVSSVATLLPYKGESNQ